MYVNSGDPDQTSRSVAADLGLHSLPMSHKMDDRLIWVDRQNMDCQEMDAVYC